MPMLDVFNDDAFSVTSMTARVNEGVYVPGQVGRLGVFAEEGVSTTSIAIEARDNELTLVAPSPRGGPGETAGRNHDKLRSFIIPHFQRDDTVMADEIQGRRAFGTETEVETVQTVVDRKAARHVRALDATLEHQRIGALKGIVTNKSGATMYDLYNEFGIAAPTAVDFALATDTTKVRTKCYELKTRMEDALEDTYDAIHALVGSDFWIKLIEHKSVKEAYLNTIQAAELRGDPAVDQFEFGGIVWHRYRTGRKAKVANAEAPFIAADTARFFFTGVPDLFITRFAPADYIETVNTDGLPRYAKIIPMMNDKGVAMEVQTNAINLCTRPGTLFEGVVAA
jgi:hypothetical protein